MTRRPMLTAVLILTTALAVALPAMAKGPGSATLDGPGIDEPIQFLHQSKSFESYETEAPVEMLRLTGLWHGHSSQAMQAASGDLGPAYEVSWGNPAEPAGTIVQYIYLDASDGPLIHTPEQDSLEDWGDSVIGWFEAPEGLEEAIEEIIYLNKQDRQLPVWSLPAIAVAAVAGLAAWGRRNEDLAE